jgi:tripartite-type tricarboxylate transporter receptor subunit TctC
MKSKKNICIKFLILVVIAISIFSFTGAAANDAYPTANRTIEIVVPYAAGGGTDVLTRVIMKYIDIGAPVVATNIEGASSGIGTMEVYHAPADGYKLLCNGPESMLAFNISGSMATPAWKDLIPLSAVVSDPNVIVVHPSSPYKTFDDFVEDAKKRPGEISYGAVGTGGVNHLNSAQIWDAVGIKVNYVPFDSAAKSRAAIMGGHIDMALMQISEASAVVKSGDLRAILVTTKERSDYLPDIETIAELGFEEAVFAQHRAFWAPPETPAEIVKKWEEEFKRISENSEFVNEIQNTFFLTIDYLDSESVQKTLLDLKPSFEYIIENYVKK